MNKIATIFFKAVPLSFEPTGEMLVVGSDGALLGARPSDLLGSEAVGRSVGIQAVPGLAEPLQAALDGTENVEQLFTVPGANEKVALVALQRPRGRAGANY